MREITSTTELFARVERNFPIYPVPSIFFWDRKGFDSAGDIPNELRSRISGRPWPDITVNDWEMIGVSPSLSSLFMEPSTFSYYIPSLIVLSAKREAPIGYFVESVVPANAMKTPRGEWWAKFVKSVEGASRSVIVDYIRYLSSYRLHEIDEANRANLERAMDIWY